jgi:hypothetical protein
MLSAKYLGANLLYRISFHTIFKESIMSEQNTAQTDTDKPAKTASETATSEAATDEAAPATEKRKTPLEMVRERQANMQAARRGVGKKGAKGGEDGGGAHGADGVSKPVQIKRQMVG